VTSPVLRLLRNPRDAVFGYQHPPIGNLTTPVDGPLFRTTGRKTTLEHAQTLANHASPRTAKL
jgi:hypothetical protein